MFLNLACCFAVLPPSRLLWHCVQQKEQLGEERENPHNPNACLLVCPIVSCTVKGTEDFPQAFENISFPMHLSSKLPYWLLKNEFKQAAYF